jgi:3-oxoacyl-[acyl-carrier protein] reductase
MMKTPASPSVPKVALITGASRGLGCQLAVRFGRGHWQVVVNFKERKQEAEKVAQTISQLGGQAIVYQADVRSRESVGQMVEAVLGQWNRIDLLINNAGITKDDLLIKMDESCWDEVLDTNLKGSFHCIQAVAKTMIRQKAGHVINIASLAGLQGAIGQAAYSASKAGLIGLTKAAARELGPFGIQVNAVLPGFLPTEMGLNLSQNKKEKIIEANVLRRSTTMEEVADFVFHLSSMASASGQVFNLDSRIAY